MWISYFNAMLLVITYVCNANCSHCYTYCGPHRAKEIMSEGMAKKIIDEAWEDKRIGKNLTIGGGEAGIYHDLLLSIISHGTLRGFYVAMVTNCFRATSPQEAEKMCEEYSSAGLKRIEISTDSFHDPYIKLEYTGNTIEAARKAGIDVCLRFAVSKNSRVGDLLKRLKDYDLSNVTIMSQPAAAIGRAKNLEDELYKMESLPSRNCLDFLTITVTPPGDIYPCCLGSELTEYLRLGNVTDTPLSKILDEGENNFLVKQVLTKGPAGILNLLTSELAMELKNRSYLNICEMCNRIFENHELVKEIKKLDRKMS